MNREIKFRAWDGREMFQVEKLDLVADCAYEGLTMCDDGDNDGAYCHFGRNEKGKLMQFTGLLDKNGKEIYEGDVLAFNETVMSDLQEDKPNYVDKRKVNNFLYASGKVGERWYGREIKVVEWISSSCGFEPFADSQDNCGHCGGADNAKFAECIGNIFENPELLNPAKNAKED